MILENLMHNIQKHIPKHEHMHPTTHTQRKRERYLKTQVSSSSKKHIHVCTYSIDLGRPYIGNISIASKSKIDIKVYIFLPAFFYNDSRNVKYHDLVCLLFPKTFFYLLKFVCLSKYIWKCFFFPLVHFYFLKVCLLSTLTKQTKRIRKYNPSVFVFWFLKHLSMFLIYRCVCIEVNLNFNPWDCKCANHFNSSL